MSVDPSVLKAQLGEYVPAEIQQLLAGAGIRDELIYPVPILIEAQPTLVGYYRLLLGVSQKEFYRTGTGMGQVKGMELTGTLNNRRREAIPGFCYAMAQSLTELISGMSPPVSARDIAELPLLTLGAQFRGANNVSIGKQATLDVFLGVAEIVEQFITSRTDRQLTLQNASKRRVIIALAADPDIRIQEEFDGAMRNKVAIEIKGGADFSNVHNRAGEAEKSHRKAKTENFRDFWTIITTRNVSLDRLREESPTTNSWFDFPQVVAQQGDDWEDFKSRIVDEVGIPA